MSGKGDMTKRHDFLPPPRLEASDEEEDGWEEGSEASTPAILPSFLRPESFQLTYTISLSTGVGLVKGNGLRVKTRNWEGEGDGPPATDSDLKECGGRHTNVLAVSMGHLGR